MLNYDEILQELASHDESIDKVLVEKAIHMAVKYHGNQLRDSGEPYYTHPIEVAKIVAEMKMDTSTIVTALLHDTVEDTELTLEDIKTHFGDEIASLVDGVTKLKKVKLTKEQISQAENFRKLLLAMVEDIRVLLVRLADRLHNMRTISFKSPAKKAKISLETLEIYAPLAERIGVNKIKNELQDISFCNLYPDVYEMVIRKLNEISANRQALINNIVEELSNFLVSENVDAEIFGRAKTPYSIWMKMVNKNTAFDDLSDIIGFRILVNSKQECYKALGIIHSSFKIIPGTFHDFISMPKHNGYQSLHTVVVGPMQRNIEIQIRTHEMHDVAELGLAAHWGYKQQYQATDFRNYRWIRELVSILEHSSSSEEVLQHTKLAMYYSQIFCFTPKGDIISLPKKATTIDFAYAVHSDIGHHCIGAKVNGKLVPLRSELKTGDMVEMLVSQNHYPSSSWEDIVITGKAKSEIKKFLRNQGTEASIRLGKNLIENAFLSSKIQGFDKVLPNIAAKLQKNIQALYLSVGLGEISAEEIINLSNIKPQETRSIFQLIRKKSETSKTYKIPISGLVPGILVNFAKCCNPIPEDKIIGIVYTGKGVTIHVSECKIALQLQPNTEKIFNLSWDNSEEKIQYVCRIKIISHADNHIISTITGHMSKYNVHLINLQLKKIDQFFNEVMCDVEVLNLSTLNNLMNSLKSEKLVYSIARHR
jgi:guanosine-3',5'-bis(diphosphate) 3'-pyrophosphohydrolase